MAHFGRITMSSCEGLAVLAGHMRLNACTLNLTLFLRCEIAAHGFPLLAGSKSNMETVSYPQDFTIVYTCTNKHWRSGLAIIA